MRLDYNYPIKKSPPLIAEGFFCLWFVVLSYQGSRTLQLPCAVATV